MPLKWPIEPRDEVPQRPYFVRFVGLLLSFGLSAFSAQGQVTGQVFRDYNGDGIRQPTEPLVGGVVVQAYNTTNVLCASVTTGSTADGNGQNYALSGCTGPVRVEFSIPGPVAQVCGLNNQLDFPGGGGANYGSAVQFTSAPGVAHFAIASPHEYASPKLANPKLFTSCYVSGNNTGSGNVGDADAFVGVDYNPVSNNAPAPAHYANTRQIGATWGIAYSKQAKRVFTSAVLKRHTGLGPLGSGGIYLIDPSVQLPATNGVINFLDFDAIGIATRGSGTYAGATVAGPVVPFSPVVGSNTERGLGTNLDSGEKDAQALAQVGRVSFGDLDISDDGRYLYVMNLYDSRLYEIDLTDPANPVAPTAANRATKIRSWAIPKPCNAATGAPRSWGIDYYRGKAYIGVVCDASISQNSSDLSFTIYELDRTAGVFSAKLSHSLDFGRGVSDGFRANGSARTGWFGWTNDWSKLVQGTDVVNWPQPILSDLEFDTDGSIVLGFIDRAGLQGGWWNFSPIANDSQLYMTITGGDILRAYKRNDCNWELESGGKEGPSSAKAATGGAFNGEGPGGGEFYHEEKLGTSHRETALGGLGMLWGSGDVVSTVYDPFGFDSFGLAWFDNTTGQRDKAFEVFWTGNSGTTPNTGTFSKGISLGDVEVQTELAPIEIGNRIWDDTDKDGIQDAGEAGFAGVSVTLSTGSGTPIATATTDANGSYYFSSGSGTSTLSAVYDLTALTAQTGYQLKYPTYTAGKALVPANAGADHIDSDAPVSGVLSFSTTDYGQANHSFDVGYSAVPCALTLTATAGQCNPQTNEYAVSGTLSFTNAVAGVATLTDGLVSTTLTIPAGATSVAYALTGLVAGTSSHTITVTVADCGSTAAMYTAPAACLAGPSLSLAKTVSASRAQLGDVVSYTVTVTNTGPVAATGVVVNDVLGTGISPVPGSFVVSAGSFAPSFSGGNWTLTSLPAGATATLVYSASLTAAGVLVNMASVPDEEVQVCTTVPYRVCSGQSVAIPLNAAGGFTRYQWYRTAPGSSTATLVADGTLSSFTATLPGEYRVVIDNGLVNPCGQLPCCPFVIEETQVPLFTVQAQNPTCTGATPQANGQLQVAGLGSNADTRYDYQYVAASSFNGASATPVAAVPANGVLATNLVVGTYTVRITNRALGCFRDITVSLVDTCTCPPTQCLSITAERLVVDK